MDIPSYLIGAIKGAGSAGVKYVVVQTLPSTGEEGTIYLVPKSTSKTNNVYDEYMYISNNWELIGNTEADLSNYQTLLSTTNKLNADYIDDTNTTNKLTNATEKSTWNGKQDALVSGTNIKTINNESILGSGNIDTEIIQYSTMPTATSGTVGKIVQYIGTTDSTYTNGYFYQCVSDGQSTPTYSWEQLDVQPSSGGSEDVAEIYACDFDSWASVSNTIKEKIYAILNKTTDEKRKILLLNTNRFNGPQLFHCHTIYNDSIIYLSTEGTIQETGNSDTQLKTFSRQIRIYSNRITLTDNKYAVGGPYLASDNDYSTPYTPLYNGSPATKKYVDDKPTTYTGYDATKTQVLKNINGVLTWVTEE